MAVRCVRVWLAGLVAGAAPVLFAAGPAAGLAHPAGDWVTATVAGGCPETTGGGPFWRVCTKPLFTADPAQPATAAAQATITVPCPARNPPDFKQRHFSTTRSTTDEGYVYFSYSNGRAAPFEVGLEHNAKAGNAVSYKLYASGVPGNPLTQAPPNGGQITCGQPFVLVFGIGDNQSGSGSLIAAVLSATEPTQIFAQLQLPVPSARSWVACGCRLSMVTAIAQNGPGRPPPTPLPDGASYGPVGWANVKYLADNPAGSNLGWRPVTAADIQYSKPFTGGVASIPTPAGTAPNLTVGPIKLPCSTNATTWNDYWTC